jgi:hypothetical protein
MLAGKVNVTAKAKAKAKAKEAKEKAKEATAKAKAEAKAKAKEAKGKAKEDNRHASASMPLSVVSMAKLETGGRGKEPAIDFGCLVQNMPAILDGTFAPITIHHTRSTRTA